MKKLLALVIALLMLCSASALAVEELPGYYKPPVMLEGQYPIAEKGVQLKYWMPINSGAANFIASYDENPTYQQAQGKDRRRPGVHPSRCRHCQGSLRPDAQRRRAARYDSDAKGHLV